MSITCFLHAKAAACFLKHNDTPVQSLFWSSWSCIRKMCHQSSLPHCLSLEPLALAKASLNLGNGWFSMGIGKKMWMYIVCTATRLWYTMANPEVVQVLTLLKIMSNENRLTIKHLTNNILASRAQVGCSSKNGTSEVFNQKCLSLGIISPRPLAKMPTCLKSTLKTNNSAIWFSWKPAQLNAMNLCYKNHLWICK